jgi:hypothetical protein
MWNFFLFLVFIASHLGAQPLTSETMPVVSSPTPTVVSKWAPASIPWDDWFKKNALVSDKGGYVEFFWNAQDFKGNFETADKKERLGEAALALMNRLYPSGAKADAVKVDIVYVLNRDSYGQPSWDSLQQVAHLEFSKSKAAKMKKNRVLTPADLKKIFTQFELYE